MAGRAGRAVLIAVLAAAVAGLGAIGVASWRGVLRLQPQRELTPPEARAAAWRAAGLSPSGTAEAHLAAGQEALRADLPARDAEALRHFAEALALDPASPAALAGWIDAFAAVSGDDPDGEELREAHRLAAWALGRAPGRADLLAAWSRLLLLVPSGRNGAEALAAAEKAVEAGGGADALLALAQARLSPDPRGAAEAAARALQAAPADRRPLDLGARARWSAGDLRGALALLEQRLALDPAQPAALSLQARILVASGRSDAARQVLRRWAAASGAAEPMLLQAMLAYQVDGDLEEGKRLLQRARALPADDFLLARILSHAAAVERSRGDAGAARRLVDQALARVPASGPARYQEALLAFARGDAAGHRRAAGVLAGRAGPLETKVLAARTLELSGQVDEAVAAWEALAAGSRDLPLLLRTAAAMARLRAPGRAVPLLLRAAAADPAAPRARRQLGDYWEGPAGMVAAARDLESLAADERVVGPALAAAATCELLLGRTAAAAALAQRAAALAPQLARARVILAQIALDRGRIGDAVREASAAIEAEPSSAVALALLSRALEAAGRGDAVDVRARALALDPGLPTARLAQARWLLRSGKRDQGIALLRQILADDPDDALARGALLDAEPHGR
jgi:tetratricopeptide (TPR) repeat protein